MFSLPHSTRFFTEKWSSYFVSQMQSVENVMKLKMLSDTIKPAFLKMFSIMYLYIFPHVSLVLLTFFVLKTYFMDIQLWSGFSLPRHCSIIKKKKKKISQKGRHKEFTFYCRGNTSVGSCQFSPATMWDSVTHKYMKQVSLQHGGIRKLSNLTKMLEPGQRLNHANNKRFFFPLDFYCFED